MEFFFGKYPRKNPWWRRLLGLPWPKHPIHLHLDKWDVYGANYTLSVVIVPLLEQLKEQQHGVPPVDDVDLPNDLKSIDGDTEDLDFDFMLRRWHYVLDYMTWAFDRTCQGDLEEQFCSGEIDFYFEESEDIDKNGEPLYEMKHGLNHTFEFDLEGFKEEQEKVQEGRRLFAKYFDALWD